LTATSTPTTEERELMLRLNGSSGYANAPQCNFLRTL